VKLAALLTFLDDFGQIIEIFSYLKTQTNKQTNENKNNATKKQHKTPLIERRYEYVTHTH